MNQAMVQQQQQKQYPPKSIQYFQTSNESENGKPITIVNPNATLSYSNVGTSGGYSTRADGLLEISDSVFQNAIPNDSSAARLGEMAFRISKMELQLEKNNTLLKELKETSKQILNAISNGGIIGNLGMPKDSEIATSDVNSDSTPFKPISTIAELNEFEEHLKMPQFNKKSVSLFLFFMR